jgi:hypothetical protein
MVSRRSAGGYEYLVILEKVERWHEKRTFIQNLLMVNRFQKTREVMGFKNQ